jgi:sugar phosphate isomerase/epimerase
VFWDDLPNACRRAKSLGFDAVELFPPGPDAVDPETLRNLLADHGLSLAAVGTGAGWVKHKFTLTDPDETIREKALNFVRGTVEFAGALGAPAIIGSMQGRWGGSVPKPVALRYLGNALYKLDEHAAQFATTVLYEPLNRYETNLVNTLADGVQLLSGLGVSRVKLLADLYHMNIEEVDIAASLRAAGSFVGHVHFADSNRRAAGFGHTDFAPIVQALREIKYEGYLSAEVLPLPDSECAARQTIEAYKRFTS